MKKLLHLLCCFSLIIPLHAQDSPATKDDSVTLLNEVIVQAYASDRPLLEVPSAIGLVDVKSLERFNNTSILSAVNTIPGVRMEERSPGSYRFAIRGSSLRSPFGVRNVKMYWNGLPLTDGGGNTYLNLLDFNAISKLEIIKGPAGSLYGAGTGGVVLLSSLADTENQFQFSALSGSYGLQRYQAKAQMGTDRSKFSFNYAHQQADGYRQHTNMRRDALNTDAKFTLGSKSVLAATMFYTDLYYQTPGGLTKAQYTADPHQARPTEASPGAVAQKAAIYNKTLYGGLMYDYQWSNSISTRAGLYGSVTKFTNPALRNYEVRNENNWGARTETQFHHNGKKVQWKITGGGEYQQFYSTLTDYGNRLGVKDTLQTDDRLYSTLGLLFAQAEIDLPSDFYLTVGGSENFLNYKLNRVSSAIPIEQQRNFSPVFSPRVALLKKITQLFSAYGSISSGFSPPSLAEVRPSTGNYNNSLAPERGISYELGIRGNLWNQVAIEVAAYDFELSNTIVIQQLNGADYFINSGSSTQKGIETLLSWTPILQPEDFISRLKLWTSYTVNRYRFNHYTRNGNDYSHNKLTGSAPTVFAGGLDAWFHKRLYTNVTMNYVDKIPLNDANTDYSSPYFLMGIRMGYHCPLKGEKSVEIFGGIENVLNTQYSLGNDLNATGGRYYNAAATRNFYVGVKASF